MCPSKVTTKRDKSPQRALSDLMRECAKSERSTGDALRLMARWGVEESARNGIVERLIEMKFIDNRRFAEAYAKDKMNISGWGTQRICRELRQKGIEQQTIAEVMESVVDKDSMRERLLRMMIKRERVTRYKDNYELKGKLLRYGATLGYEYSMVSDVIAEVVESKDNEIEICENYYF